MKNANLLGTNLLVGPSIAYADWTAEDVWNTGFVSAYNENLAFLTVEKYILYLSYFSSYQPFLQSYPTDNCALRFNTGGAIQQPQTIFPDFLSHTSQFSGNSIIQKFLNSTQFALNNGKQLLMMETNTGSCGGFPGISDAFGAALWGIDYAFQMACNNFAGGMIHVGGQNVYYNVQVFHFLLSSTSDFFMITAIHTAADKPVNFPPMDCRTNILLCPCCGRIYRPL